MDALEPASGGAVCPCCAKQDCEAYRSHVQLLEQRIAALEEENAQLSLSANTFGDLAERLNERLRDKRHTGVDRRESYRPSPDRRSRTANGA